MPENKSKKADSLEGLVALGTAGLEGCLGYVFSENYVLPFLGYSPLSYIGCGITLATTVAFAYVGYHIGKFAYSSIIKPVVSGVADVIYSIGSFFENLFSFGYRSNKKEPVS